MTTTDQALAANVRAEMARASVTQQMLAGVLGISQVGVSKRLRGDTPWRVDEVVRIAAYLGVPVSVLVPESKRVA